MHDMKTKCCYLNDSSVGLDGLDKSMDVAEKGKLALWEQHIGSHTSFGMEIK